MVLIICYTFMTVFYDVDGKWHCSLSYKTRSRASLSLHYLSYYKITMLYIGMPSKTQLHFKLLGAKLSIENDLLAWKTHLWHIGKIPCDFSSGFTWMSGVARATPQISTESINFFVIFFYITMLSLKKYGLPLIYKSKMF